MSTSKRLYERKLRDLRRNLRREKVRRIGLWAGFAVGHLVFGVYGAGAALAAVLAAPAALIHGPVVAGQILAAASAEMWASFTLWIGNAAIILSWWRKQEGLVDFALDTWEEVGIRYRARRDKLTPWSPEDGEEALADQGSIRHCQVLLGGLAASALPRSGLLQMLEERAAQIEIEIEERARDLGFEQ